jgi:Zn-dependent protease
MEGDASGMNWRWRVVFGAAWLLRWAVGILCCVPALGWGMAWLGSETVFALALVVWALMFAPAVVIHELGHYAAARVVGMLVLSVRLGPLLLAMRRRGFRARWQPQPAGPRVAGCVYAVAGGARPSRNQKLAFTLGGSLANLAAALVLAACGLAWRPLGLGWCCLMFASMNVVVGMANLLPSRKGSGNDGYQLLCLLLNPPEPEPPQQRLYRLSLFGCTADRLPEADLAALEQGPFPLPLEACWYRLKAAQNRGEWERAAAMADTLDALLAGWDAQESRAWRDWLAVTRTELAFSRAMHAHDADALAEDVLTSEAAWWQPHLRPRCQALRAALQGDREGYVRLLERSRRLADNAVDRALPISEGMIRADMTKHFPVT